MEAKCLLCKSNSKLTVKHLTSEYQVKDDLLSQYYHLVMNLVAKLEEFKIEHVPRSDNVRADLLSKLASTKKKGRYRSLLQQVLTTSSIQTQTECFEVTTKESWMSPFITYLKKGKVPANQERGWVRKATRYTLIAGELYRRGFSKPLLRCITSDKAFYVMQKIHEGTYGYHSGPKTMAARILRAGYF